MARRGDSIPSHSANLPAAQLLGVIVLSLGLWAAIWDALASLASAAIR